MANNIVLNPGVGGDTVAMEDIGGVKYDLIKLIDPSAGSTTPIGTAANALRCDPTGATIQPVSGSVTALAQPGVDIGDVTINNPSIAVTGTFWQATQPVSAASLPLPSGAATQATLATLDGKVTVCNTGAVTVGAALPVGTNRIGAIYLVSGQLVDENGVLRSINRAFANATLISNTEVVAAQGPGVKIRVLSVTFVVLLAVTVKFQSDTTDITAGFPLAANGGMAIPYNPHGMFETAANQALNINLSLGTTVGCSVTWCQA